ncbi:cardiolipin synthase [Candidatus Pacearchaeota archaeon CG10_big_fil_rev_8_21_14_0_10_35_13]|nr:MAG: cardiolipin synthase [Candidatus Pacearchaeota archaeon CG10_big_fil_rev_8_21_14_0_10_35_13]
MELITIIWLSTVIIVALYIISVIFYLLLDNRSPETTIAWVMIILTLPIIGLLAYLFLGKNWRRKTRKMLKERRNTENRIKTFLKGYKELHEATIKNIEGGGIHPQTIELVNLLRRNSGALITADNEVKIIQKGIEKFELLMKDLEKAKKHIHLEYYIWKSDELTKKIHEILIRKAKEGVEVRLMYDAIGGKGFKNKDKKELRKAGIKVRASSTKLQTLNYRNHRKVAVIDGRIAYVGGMNVAKEYIDGGKKFKKWRDTHLRITGSEVLTIQGIFIVSWYRLTNEELFSNKYFPKPEITGKTLLQTTTSGPDSKWEAVKQLYFSLINSVDKYIYLETPYFLPDESINMALKTAALRGLDVRIIITGVPDYKVAYHASKTFYKGLLEAGVRIYEYMEGFMHSKTLVLDDEISTVGTANLDPRSFTLNYELNTLIIDKKKALELKKTFNEDLKGCKEITLRNVESWGIISRIGHSIARLFAPLL